MIELAHMTKEFCNLCGAELTTDNDTRYIHHSRCAFKVGGGTFRIEQIGVEHVDICKECVAKAIASTFNKPKFWLDSCPLTA